MVDIIKLGSNAYSLAYKLKKAEVFTILIRNLKFQAKKKAKPETDSKDIMVEKYYNLLDIFL